MQETNNARVGYVRYLDLQGSYKKLCNNYLPELGLSYAWHRTLTLAVTLDFVRSIKEPSLEAPSGQLKKLLKDLSSLKDVFKEEFDDELKIPYSSSNNGQKALPI